VGLGKPKLFTKFEVPRFSRCVNIEVEPQNFGQHPLAKGHAHPFPLGVIILWDLANPSSVPNLKSLASAIT